MWSAIYQGGHRRQCARYAIKDGFCRQHHPEEVEKREAHQLKKLEYKPISLLIRPRN